SSRCGEDRVSVFTPKALHPTAQGRAAHPGPPPWDHFGIYPEGVGSTGACRRIQPLRGTERSGRPRCPGCAARPWALGSNAFGVKADTRSPTPGGAVMQLNSHVPSGPLAEKWDKHKFDLKLVNPA